uniref:Uncharacterized protein n=1 Tax=Lygus hesperus TaxID=30085 RepID=A0A146LX22_LYGHE
MYTQLVQNDVEIIYDGVKYNLRITKSSPTSYDVSILMPMVGTTGERKGMGAAPPVVRGEINEVDTSAQMAAASSTTRTTAGAVGATTQGDAEKLSKEKDMRIRNHHVWIASIDVHNLSDGGY